MTSKHSPTKGHRRIEDEIQGIRIVTNQSRHQGHYNNTQEHRIIQAEVSYHFDAADGLAPLVGFNEPSERARAISLHESG